MLDDAAAAALPPPNGFLKAYVDYAKDRTDAPVIFHIGAGLSLLAAASGPSLTYNGFGREHSPTNLYILLVGRTGEARKSTAITLAQELLQPELAGLIGQMPGSDEGLVESLHDQPNQLLFFSEFHQFLSASGGQTYLRALRSRITEVYDGTPIARKRMKKTTEAKKPRLSILGGATLMHLEDGTTEVDWAGGFMNRYMIILGDREKHYESLPPPSTDRVEVVRLLRARYEARVGYCFGRTPAAQEAFRDFTASLRTHHNRSEFERALLARVGSQVEKMSVLLAHDIGVSQEARYQVPVEAMLPAIEIGKLLFEAAQILSVRIAANAVAQDRRRVVDALVGEGGQADMAELIPRCEFRYTNRQLGMILESLVAEKRVATTTDDVTQKPIYSLVDVQLPLEVRN